jgi:hypothetical protein
MTKGTAAMMSQRPQHAILFGRAHLRAPLLALLLAALSSCSESTTPPRADAGVDAHVATDSGPEVDSGSDVDSGAAADAGSATDAGAETDAGSPSSCAGPTDCVFSVYDHEILSPADCDCISCPSTPSVRSDDERRAAQYAALCTPGFDATGAPCPMPRCARPGPITCSAGACVPDSRVNACVEAADCVYSVYAEDILAAADCYCPMCPSTLLNTWTATGRATRYAALCTPGFDAMGNACFIPPCVAPPAATCNAGLCE